MKLRFPTEDGLTLEGELRMPGGDPVGTAVICHPHPQHGGSKDHPLLWAIRSDLAGTRGFAVLAFNFRGVMGSEGEKGDGTEEVKDARAAITRVREEAGGPTVVVGWSFGATVALREATGDDRVAGLAIGGYPLADVAITRAPLPPAEELRAFETPTLIVVADDDRFSPVHAVLELTGTIPNAEVRVFEGAGHLFARREREAAEAIGEFAARVAQDR